MSTLFSDPAPATLSAQVVAFPYPEIGSRAISAMDASEPRKERSDESRPLGPSPAEIDAMIERARVEARSQTEKHVLADCELRVQKHAQQIKEALDRFATERDKYFAQIETEVVRLSLAIARRILHREAQVDQLLVAALVRVAVERIEVGSGICVRVAAEECQNWREYLADLPEKINLSVVADVNLRLGECVLETEMGSTELGIDAQLHEVEKGFFDLLAQRPFAS